MNINTRIREIREKFCNGSNVEFAKKLEKAPNTTSNWVRSGYSVGRGVSSEIAAAFGVDLNWLLTGEGEMLKAPKNPFSQMTERKLGESISEVIMEMYTKGEIYPASIYDKVIAEKNKELSARDRRIEELQREVWRLQNQIDDLSK